VAEADRAEHTPNRYDRNVRTSATPATALLARAGVPHHVHEYAPAERHGRAREARPDYGLEAAAALGIEPARMGKTLIALVDGVLVAAVVPVERSLDPKALAAALSGRRAELAEPAVAERATGSVVGGISPLSMRRALPVVIDEALLGHSTVFVSAGRRGLQVELGPSDLVRLTAAVVGSITRSG
jgi:Cys-tRNA(Pro)/Cys-tRNA(Cys) deacylase